MTCTCIVELKLVVELIQVERCMQFTCCGLHTHTQNVEMGAEGTVCSDCISGLGTYFGDV